MNPISRNRFKRLSSELRWKRAEKHAKKVLEDKFGKSFSKEDLIVGKPREFDLVSSDKSIIVQVK